MMKLVKIVAVMTLLSSLAYADKAELVSMNYGPLEVVDARYGFKNVTSDVAVRLSQADAQTSLVMMLDYFDDDHATHVVLEVTKSEIDACGSKHFYARLPKEDPANGVRYNVHLVDHTERTCDDVRHWIYEAKVRSGFGWCGTGDSEMTLQGNGF